MQSDDTYLTIEAPATALFKDRGSKFLSFVYPVRNETEVRDYRMQLKELHPKAVHHCYAYRLDQVRFRASDDGEPAGTAGKPILNTLYSRELTDVLVVVVRYFGGTLLGVPGLIHAYKSASEAALDEAVVVTRFRTTRYLLSFPYEKMNAVMKIVKEMELSAEHPVYELTCGLEVAVRDTLKEHFLERCAGIGSLVLTGPADGDTTI